MEQRFCPNCGKELKPKIMPNGVKESPSWFQQRKFCDRLCMSNYYHKTHQKSGNVSWYVAHKRAREVDTDTACKICGATKNIDIHHIDGNIQNNSLENLIALCRSCHMKQHRKRHTCRICGKPAKGHHLCNKHYIRWKNPW